jgi:hypothetical protein
MAEDIGSLGVTLRALVKTDQTKVKVDRFTKADDPGAVGYQVKAIELSKKPLELYSVRLTDEDKKVFHVWSFVHEDGTFRYVGKLRELLTDKQRTISPVSKHDTLEFTAEDAARIMAVESPADAGPP